VVSDYFWARNRLSHRLHPFSALRLPLEFIRRYFVRGAPQPANHPRRFPSKPACFVLSRPQNAPEPHQSPLASLATPYRQREGALSNGSFPILDHRQASVPLRRCQQGLRFLVRKELPWFQDPVEVGALTEHTAPPFAPRARFRWSELRSSGEMNTGSIHQREGSPANFEVPCTPYLAYRSTSAGPALTSVITPKSIHAESTSRFSKSWLKTDSTWGRRYTVGVSTR
jgi:hypothetical protein